MPVFLQIVAFSLQTDVSSGRPVLSKGKRPMFIKLFYLLTSFRKQLDAFSEQTCMLMKENVNNDSPAKILLYQRQLFN